MNRKSERNLGTLLRIAILIFGLGFATFLTLIMVPVMYLLTERIRNRVRKWRNIPIDTGVLAKPVGELATAPI